MVPTEGTGVGGSEGRFAEIENPQIIISEDMSLALKESRSIAAWVTQISEEPVLKEPSPTAIHLI
jgi:hypothetical protein